MIRGVEWRLGTKRRFGRLRFQHFGDARQGAPGSCCARSDGFRSLVESVPGERLYVRTKHEIGMAFPGLKLVFLRGADGTSDHLKDVRWRAAIKILHADGNADHTGGAKRAGGARRNGRDEAAIGEASRADLDRSEEPRERAARTDRVNKIALRENDGLAGGQVGGDDGKRNAQLFKLSGLKDAMDQVGEPLIAGQAKAGWSPAGNIAKPELAARGNNALERSSAGIGRAKNAANAGPGDVRDGNAVLLEGLQHAEVRKSAREAPSESESDAPARLGLRGLRLGAMGLRSHAPMIPSGFALNDGWRVPKRQYGCTSMEIRHQGSQRDNERYFSASSVPPLYHCERRRQTRSSCCRGVHL